MKTETVTLFRTEHLLPSQLIPFQRDDNLLVQVFSSLHDDLPRLQHILDTLNSSLPHATVIGATTDGEIESGNVYTNSTVIAFTSFETTTLIATSAQGGHIGYC